MNWNFEVTQEDIESVSARLGVSLDDAMAILSACADREEISRLLEVTEPTQ